MIRRDPTLISLSDNDVQDLRECLRRKAYANSVTGSSSGSAAVDSASNAVGGSVSSDLMRDYKDFAAKRAALAKLTKEERLGL